VWSAHDSLLVGTSEYLCDLFGKLACVLTFEAVERKPFLWDSLGAGMPPRAGCGSVDVFRLVQLRFILDEDGVRFILVTSTFADD
jgi:hypothetical protein